MSNIARISTRDFSLTLPGGLLNALINDTNSKAQVSLIEAAQQKMDRILADAYKADPAKRCP